VTLFVFVHEQGVAEIKAYLKQKRLNWVIVCQAIPESLCDTAQVVAEA